jgi:hypothetical protein
VVIGREQPLLDDSGSLTQVRDALYWIEGSHRMKKIKFCGKRKRERRIRWWIVSKGREG